MAPERYAHFDPIGRGGMGIVYLAIDTDLNREVAFKVARPERASEGGEVPCDPTALEAPRKGTPASEAFATLRHRFLREATITGRLEHPGVVPVYEVGRTDAGIPYYTMRFVRGSRTLAQAIEDEACGGLEARLALLDPFLKVCDTIGYAHAEGVIHRDLKPENVVLGEFGEVVVIDWGLARFRDPGGVLPGLEQPSVRDPASGFQTTVGAGPVGTPGYMAPEAAEGACDDLDERSDVYALGAILFQILTGRVPHPSTSAVEYLARVRAEDAPSVRELQPSVPEALAEVCAAALARDREARLPAVEAIAAGIRAWRRSDAVDRRIEVLRVEAATLLEAARASKGEEALLQLERASGPVNEILSIRPEDARTIELRESLRLVHRARLEEREQAAHRRARLRVGVAALAVLAVLGAVGALVFRHQRQVAVSAQSRAQEALRRSRALALAHASEARLRWDGDEALLLALEAVRRYPTPETMQSLRDVLRVTPSQVVLDTGSARVQTAGFSPDGSLIWVTCDDGTVRLLDREGRQRAELRPPPKEGLEDACYWDHGASTSPVCFSPTSEHLLVRGVLRHDDEHEYGVSQPSLLFTVAGVFLAEIGSGFGEWSSFSPDGRHVLTVRREDTGSGAEEPHAAVWDLQGRERAVLQGHTASIVAAAFSTGGDTIATASADGTARLWALDGRTLAELRGHEAALTDVGFLPSRGLLFTASIDQTVRIWDEKGTVVAVLGDAVADIVARYTEPHGWTTAPSPRVKVAASGRRLLVSFPRIRGAPTTRDAAAVAPPEDPLRPASCRLYRTDTWEEIARWGTLDPWNPYFAFGPDGESIVSHGADGTFHLYDEDGERRSVVWGSLGRGFLYSIGWGLEVERDSPSDFGVFRPTPPQFLVASQDGVFRLWNLDGSQVGYFEGLGPLVRAPVFSPDGDHILIVRGGEARLLETESGDVAVLRTGEPVWGVRYAEGDVAFLSLRMSDDEGPVLDGWSSAGVRLDEQRIRVEDGIVLVPSAVGPRVLRRGDLPEYTFETLGGEVVGRIARPPVVAEDRADVVAVSPSGSHLVLQDYESGEISVWDARGGVLCRFPMPEQVTRRSDGEAVAISRSADAIAPAPDASHLLLSTLGTVSLYSTCPVHRIATMRGGLGEGDLPGIAGTVFSPEGDRFVTSGGNTASIWDLTGARIAVLHGHGDRVRVWFSEDGRWVLTCSADHTARVWDRDGRLLAVLRGHEGRVTGVDVSADGTRAVTCSLDGTIRAWALTAEELLRMGEKRTPRDFTDEERRRFADLLSNADE